jgi:hypothetical protein
VAESAVYAARPALGDRTIDTEPRTVQVPEPEPAP